MFHLQTFWETDFLSVKCISFHTFVLNSAEGIYWNYEYTASCTMYLPLLDVAVGRLACEHHESIFLNNSFCFCHSEHGQILRQINTKKVIWIFRSYSRFSGIITITKQLQMNRSCFGSTIIYFKVLFSAYQDLIILFRSLIHIEKNEYTCSVKTKLTRCFRCRIPIGWATLNLFLRETSFILYGQSSEANHLDG